MGGDIHICSMILGKTHVIIIYFANLFGCVLSSISTLITIITYLINLYKQRKLNQLNPHHVCQSEIQSYQYFDQSNIDSINSNNNYSNNSTNYNPNNNNGSNNNNNNNRIFNYNSINKNENANEKDSLVNNMVIPIDTSSNYSCKSSNSSSNSTGNSNNNSPKNSYYHSIPFININQQNNNQDNNRNNNNNNSNQLCNPHCILFSDLPQHIQIKEQKTKPKKVDTLIFYLALSDFIAVTAIIVSQLMVMVDHKISKKKEFCVGTRATIHFGLLATILWSNCIAYYLLREIYEWRPYKFPFKAFHFICWGLSAIGASSLFFFKTTTTQSGNWCTVNGTYQLYFWVIPLFVSFSWNLLCYVLIYRKFKLILSFGIYGTHTHQLKRFIGRKLSLFLLAFIFTWIWDIINHSFYYYESKCPPFTLWLLQDFFGTSAGFLNFLVYVLTNKIFAFQRR